MRTLYILLFSHSLFSHSFSHTHSLSFLQIVTNQPVMSNLSEFGYPQNRVWCISARLGIIWQALQEVFMETWLQWHCHHQFPSDKTYIKPCNFLRNFFVDVISTNWIWDKIIFMPVYSVAKPLLVQFIAASLVDSPVFIKHLFSLPGLLSRHID